MPDPKGEKKEIYDLPYLFIMNAPKNFVWISFFLLLNLITKCSASLMMQSYETRTVDFLRECKHGKPYKIGSQPVLLELDSAEFRLRYRSCSVLLEADKGFGISIYVETMDLAPFADVDGGLFCPQEKIEFHSEHDGHSLGKVTRSNQICGTMGREKEEEEKVEIYYDDFGHGNEWRRKLRKLRRFHVESSNLVEVRYEQDLRANRHRNGTFTLVVTPTMPSCRKSLGSFFPCRNATKEHCVARGAFCDGHVNCVDVGNLRSDWHAKDEAGLCREEGLGEKSFFDSFIICFMFDEYFFSVVVRQRIIFFREPS